jgi:hypothetical protein
LGVAGPLHANKTLSGSGVTKSISVEEEEEEFITSGNWRGKHNSLSRGADDSHLLVDVPSDYPERIPSVDPGGVQPEMGLPGRRRIRVGGPVEPVTVAKVEGSGCPWSRTTPTNRGNSSPGLN